MADTISKGATTITPALVLSVENSAEVPTIVHRLVGGGSAYSLRKPDPRMGTLVALFLTAAEAWACFDLHNDVGVFTFTSTSIPRLSMDYVVRGRVAPELDSQTRTRWTVSIDFGQVA